MSESEDISPVDTATDRLMRWVLLSGDRLRITAVLTIGVFVVFLVFGLAGLVTPDPNRAMWFLNGTINGLLTLIPIAVGINQIVLSQELGSLDDLYDRTRGTFDFRQQIANTVDVTASSPQASEFFHDIFSAINDRATELQDACDDSDDEELKEDVDDYVGTLTEQTDDVSSGLDDLGFELLDTLLVLLDYHNSWQLHTTLRIQSAHEDTLSETANTKLDELEELFMQLDATRDYLKTLWIQHELAELSRMMLYTGIPAVLTATLAIFVYWNIPGIMVPRPVVMILLSATVAVSLLPLSVILAYIARVALVAQRTAAFGPFIPKGEQERISGQVTEESQESGDEKGAD